MALTVPPPVQGSDTVPAMMASLADTICRLYNIIHNIELPKMKMAKMTVISVDVLHLACDLVTSACMSLQDHPDSLQLEGISRQLESIMAHLSWFVPQLSMSFRSLASS